jgi:hypothetical protein
VRSGPRCARCGGRAAHRREGCSHAPRFVRLRASLGGRSSRRRSPTREATVMEPHGRPRVRKVHLVLDVVGGRYTRYTAGPSPCPPRPSPASRSPDRRRAASRGSGPPGPGRFRSRSSWPASTIQRGRARLSRGGLRRPRRGDTLSGACTPTFRVAHQGVRIPVNVALSTPAYF